MISIHGYEIAFWFMSIIVGVAIGVAIAAGPGDLHSFMLAITAGFLVGSAMRSYLDDSSKTWRYAD